MSGHSKWSTIKRAKGAADVKKGLTFTKLANAITIAAKSGGSGDVDFNPRLRVAIDEARSVNMPKDNIQRAIDRGLGKLPGQTIEEVMYEGFGPGKVAFIVEGITDNRLRTNQIVKNLFDRSGGAMGSVGSCSYLFNRIGEIRVESKGGLKEDEELELIDLGAEDIDEDEEEGVKKYSVFVKVAKLTDMSTKLVQSGYKIDSSEIVFRSVTKVEITDPELVDKVLDFASRLEEQDDIVRVFANI